MKPSEKARPPREIFRPSDIEEGGLTIPVPTPTGAVPNPWKPAPNGGGPAGQSGSGSKPDHDG